jgi:hypothetical protein
MMIRDELREILSPMFTRGEREVLNAAVTNRIHDPDAFIVNENNIGEELHQKLKKALRRAELALAIHSGGKPPPKSQQSQEGHPEREEEAL